MANIQMKFLDRLRSAKYISLKKSSDFDGKFIYIQIENENTKNVIFVELDKSTAIKLAKTLRTEINKIENDVLPQRPKF